MPIPTDRGMLVVHAEADGTTSLSICAKVINGQPTDVYARHHHALRVNIDPDVKLTPHGKNRYTQEIVEVVGSVEGVVSVRYPKYDAHP
jgi:hypothetical protein